MGDTGGLTLRRNRGASPHRVARVADVPPGSRVIVDIDGRSVGVFNVAGTFYALRNLCPHQQAPLCEGPLTGTTLPSAPGRYEYGREGQILRCPWHGWEFDVTTGRSVFDPVRCRVRAYPVTVETLPGVAPTTTGHYLQVERFDVSVDGPYLIVYV
jgi:nitrite reductase (NADH) small subunit